MRSWARNLSHPAFRLPCSRRNLRLNRLEDMYVYNRPIRRVSVVAGGGARIGRLRQTCMAGLAEAALVAWVLRGIYPLLVGACIIGFDGREKDSSKSVISNDGWHRNQCLSLCFLAGFLAVCFFLSVCLSVFFSFFICLYVCRSVFCHSILTPYYLPCLLCSSPVCLPIYLSVGILVHQSADW